MKVILVILSILDDGYSGYFGSECHVCPCNIILMIFEIYY